MQFITAAFTIVGIVIMMFTISWQMSILACGTARRIVPLLDSHTQIAEIFPWAAAEAGLRNSYVEEQYSGHTVVKLYGTEQRTEGEFDAMSDDLNEDARRAQFASSIMMPVTNLVGNIGYVGIACWAA